jgi:hypothetical protein
MRTKVGDLMNVGRRIDVMAESGTSQDWDHRGGDVLRFVVVMTFGIAEAYVGSIYNRFVRSFLFLFLELKSSDGIRIQSNLLLMAE